MDAYGTARRRATMTIGVSGGGGITGEILMGKQKVRVSFFVLFSFVLLFASCARWRLDIVLCQLSRKNDGKRAFACWNLDGQDIPEFAFFFHSLPFETKNNGLRLIALPPLPLHPTDNDHKQTTGRGLEDRKGTLVGR